MAYKDLLAKTIKDSGLSLREISSRCSILGINITPSYISQIQTGKLPPPSEEVSNVLAKVCKVDATELILEGYLEKAPNIIKDYIITASETNKQLLNLLIPYFNNKEKQELIDMVEKADKVTRLNLSISYLKKLQRKHNIKPVIDLYKTLTSKNRDDYKYDEYENIFIEDDSMEPTIPKGANIKYISYDENSVFEDGDIVIFEIIGQKDFMIRRYYKNLDSILFVADNKQYKIIPIQDTDTLIFIGKAIKYESIIK